jgi:hypothetical protein
MAGRRCLSSKITESDPFYNLPESAQALYTHLNMVADDDGFINNAASVSSRIKNGAAALRCLVEKRFLLKYDDVYVVKHWRISNSLKNDRLKPLSYASVAQKVWVKPNRAYTDHETFGCITLFEMRTGTKPPGEWIPNGFQTDSTLFPIGFPTEDNLTEPKITEDNRTEYKDLAGAFREILEAYPEDKRGNAVAAETAYRQAVQGIQDIRLMRDNLEQWKQSEQWDKENGKYIPYLCNWILRGTWRGKPDKLVVPKGGSGVLGQAEMEAIEQLMRKRGSGIEQTGNVDD